MLVSVQKHLFSAADCDWQSGSAKGSDSLQILSCLTAPNYNTEHWAHCLKEWPTNGLPTKGALDC